MRPRAVQGGAAERGCSNIEDRLRQKIPGVGKVGKLSSVWDIEKGRVSIGDRV